MKNSILSLLRESDGKLYAKVVKLFADYRELDFTATKQKDVMVVTPSKALEYSGDEGNKYFKVWMVGSKIGWCTWANTLIDSNFRYKKSGPDKRDNNDLIGNEPYVTEYRKSYDAVEKCSVVYMFPFTAIPTIKKKK